MASQRSKPSHLGRRHRSTVPDVTNSSPWWWSQSRASNRVARGPSRLTQNRRITHRRRQRFGFDSRKVGFLASLGFGHQIESKLPLTPFFGDVAPAMPAAAYKECRRVATSLPKPNRPLQRQRQSLGAPSTDLDRSLLLGGFFHTMQRPLFRPDSSESPLETPECRSSELPSSYLNLRPLSV
jgi:hypothetical protein